MEFILVVFLVVLALFLFVLSLYLYKKNREFTQKLKYMHSADVKSDVDVVKEKELFLAKVSHQLNIPANAILGLAQVTLQSDLDSVQYRNISKIKHFADVLLEITNDIVDITKIDIGSLKINNKKFDINEVLEHISSVFLAKTADKDVELIYNVDKSVPSCLVGDSLRLGQILINLIDNALKFSDKSDVEVYINNISEDFENKIGLEFRVIDHGAGMDKKQVTNILNKFANKGDLYGGTGLGLSVTKQLIRLMDGSIDIKSDKGIGTEVIVKMYFTKHEINNKRNYRLPSKELMSKKAVIVASNRRGVESLSNMLKYFHYKVEIISSLTWAQETLAENSYDMIFIDENTVLDNSEAIIKNIKNKYDIKVIVIESVYYKDSAKLKNLEEVDCHIIKPFNQDSVYNMILDIYNQDKSLKTQKKIDKNDFSIYENIHIMVVEENELSQKIFTTLLDDTGIEVTMTKNSEELIDKLNKNDDINLIVVDVDINTINSCEITKEIRAIQKYSEVPIYALVSDSDEEIEGIKICGMQGYFTKPLVTDSFYGKLFNIFNEKDKQRLKLKSEEKPEDKIDSDSFIFKELDYKYGLDKCEQNTSKYMKLLDDFTRLYSNGIVTLDAIMKEERYSDGEHFVKDLKTLSSQIGGKKLSKSASNIEKAFVDSKLNKNSILIDRLKRDLKMLLADIKRYKKP